MNKIKQREWRAKNPDKTREYNRRAVAKHGRRPMSAAYQRDHHLKKKYGLSAVEWDVLFAAQNYRCASCGSGDPGGKYWHTDHAGALPCSKESIRGILCLHCNHAIGKGTADDLARQRARAAYLEKWL